MTVSVNSIITNIILSIFKFIAGIFAHSGAMISDAIHSASDVMSTVIVIIGVKISGKAADREHQYGHERYECVAAIILAIILAATGAAIGYEAILKIIEGKYQDLVIPGKLALIAAVVSIIVKEIMYWYTRSAAKKLNSTALMADAWHHRSDALSSIGSLIGVAGSRMGFPILDKVASLGICFFIVKAALSIFADAIRKMIDESCDKELEEEMRSRITKQEGVIAIDILKTRKFGDKIYVDVEIVVDGNLSLFESHRIAEKVHDEVEHQFNTVKHCMVHVNPDNNIKIE
ncbi:MAG: cation diffusion facilitator family transporter [bacterium]|nr:cation diffusion facilitator family transporter [bacterium]